MYDVYVARLGGTTYAVRSNGRVIAKVPSGTDCSRLLKAAVDAVPSGGSLNIRGGTYVVKAPYAMALNPDDTNLFFTGFPVIGKDMHIYEAQQKRLNDLAIGKIVTGKISIDDQIAALRKQIGALSEAAKVPIDADFQALEDLVESEKAKKGKKSEPPKAKKTAKKSG
ncbi:MAG: hypothetical protein WC110_12400 [Bacteroidales bacterium]